MTSNERAIIRNLMLQLVSKEDFIRDFTVDVTKNPSYIQQLLTVAYNEKESIDVEYLLIVGFKFNLFSDEYVEILCTLIQETWHYQHENIAMILQKLKSPLSVECLYQTTISEFEYLEYDESYALAVKCIWALGEINTIESQKKLEILAQSENKIIRDNAIKQLKRKA